MVRITSLESICLISLLLISTYGINVEESRPLPMELQSAWETLEGVVVQNYSKSSHILLDIKTDSSWNYHSIHGGIPGFDQRSDIAPIFGTDQFLYYVSYFIPNQWVYKYYLLDLSKGYWKTIDQETPDDQYTDIDFASIYGTNKILIMKTLSQNRGLVFSIYNGINQTETALSQDNMEVISNRSEAMIVSIADSGKVLLWGGRNGIYPNYINYTDMWIFDIITSSWTKVYQINCPSLRFYQAVSPIWGTDKILMFGGVNNTILNETWIFDISDSKWTSVFVEKTPVACTFADMAPIFFTNKVLLYGGNDGLYNIDEMYEFDLGTMNWNEINTKISPGPRAKHFMAEVDSTGQVLLWGGSDLLDYYFLYNTSQHITQGKFFTRPYEIEFDEILKEIHWEGSTPEGTSIDFQIRYANTSQNLLKENFLGPYGDDYYNEKNVTLNYKSEEKRWIQICFRLKTVYTISTPILDSIKIIKNYPPIVNPIAPKNGFMSSCSEILFTWEYFDYETDSQKEIEIQFGKIYDPFSPLFITQVNINISKILLNISKDGFHLKDGGWFWRIKVKDYIGDWSKYSMPNYFFIDRNPPNSTILYPLEGIYNKSNDKINGIGSDRLPGSGLDKILIQIMRISDKKYINNGTWSEEPVWMNAIGTDDWYYKYFLKDGKYLISSCAVDMCGNVQAYNSNVSILIDITPPRNLSIIINNGSKETNSSTVYLTLSCQDSLSGPDEMSFSFDGLKWDNWILYNKSFLISIEKYPGEKHIYFRVKDKAGNVAEPVQNIIILNDNTTNNHNDTIKNNRDNNLFIIIISITIGFIIILLIVGNIYIRKSKDINDE